MSRCRMLTCLYWRVTVGPYTEYYPSARDSLCAAKYSCQEGAAGRSSGLTLTRSISVESLYAHYRPGDRWLPRLLCSFSGTRTRSQATPADRQGDSKVTKILLARECEIGCCLPESM